MSTSSWARKSGWLFLVGVLSNVGCFGSGRGYQLYAGPAADPSAVAKLTGFVMAVDGKKVTQHGRNFELLPGCHLVTTPRNWGGVGESGGVVANTGPFTYAINMLAGHAYSIEVKPEGSAGSIQSVRIIAKEKDATGKLTGTFSPTETDRTCAEDHRGGKDVIVPVPTLGG
jgi:hypothetical protein